MNLSLHGGGIKLQIPFIAISYPLHIATYVMKRWGFQEATQSLNWHPSVGQSKCDVPLAVNNRNNYLGWQSSRFWECDWNVEWQWWVTVSLITCKIKVMTIKFHKLKQQDDVAELFEVFL